MVVSGVNLAEDVIDRTALAAIEVDEIAAGAARVEGLKTPDAGYLIDALLAESIHGIDAVADFEVVEIAPAEIIMGEQSDVAVIFCQLKTGYCVGDIRNIFRFTAGLVDHAQKMIFPKENPVDVIQGFLRGKALDDFFKKWLRPLLEPHKVIVAFSGIKLKRKAG